MRGNPSNRTVSVICRGRPARVEIVGEGQPVVFVGTAAPMEWSAPAARSLARHNYQVVNFDYQRPPGWNEAPEPRIALDQVNDVVDVMMALDLDRAHIVGLSRGAVTAYGLAAHHRERTISLVLGFPVSGHRDLAHVSEWPPTRDENMSWDPLGATLGAIFSPAFLEHHADEARALIATPPGTVSRVDRADEEHFAATDTVSCPTLVIEGGSDQIVEPQHPARYLAAIPDAEHVLIEDAFHGWLMEQPDRFAGLLSEFFAVNRGDMG